MDSKNRWHSFRIVECCESQNEHPKQNPLLGILTEYSKLIWHILEYLDDWHWMMEYLDYLEHWMTYISLQTWVEYDDKLARHVQHVFLGSSNMNTGRVCVPTDSCAWRIGTVWAYFQNSHPMGWRIEGHCWMIAGKRRHSIWASNRTQLAQAGAIATVLVALLCVSVDVR